MKKASGLSLSFILALSAASACKGATVMTNEQRAIVAIGSLSIDGILYDVSFDGSFGTSMFLGNQAGAIKARLSIAGLLNDYGFRFNEYFNTFPHVANQTQDGTYFEITYFMYPLDDPTFPDRRDFHASYLYAGWDFSSGSRAGPLPTYAEATFREAIPGSITNSIPEPSIVAMIGFGAFIFFGGRNRHASH